jgi:hypothetical protein
VGVYWISYLKMLGLEQLPHELAGSWGLPFWFIVNAF